MDASHPHAPDPRARELTRRTLLAGAPAAGVALALPSQARAAAPAQETAYAALRIVRESPAEPDKPELRLPDGYAIVAGEAHSVASRAEYYTFIEGPRAEDGIEVGVRWPGVAIETIVSQNEHLKVREDPADPDACTVTVPVTRESVGATQATIQVWSHPDISPGMYWRIEHNDADRAAGPWTEVPWPAGEVRAVVHLLVATHAIWQDSGMTEIAAAKGHRFVLMGFETNNTLHPDNPPHWHMAYNSGPDFGSPTHNPHFWLDAEGRTFYNGMDVTGLGRLRHYVGDPAPVYDFVGDDNDGRGNLVVTFTIREDGGLDIEPADGPGYAITPGPSGVLLDEVIVLRDGEEWLSVTTDDDVVAGKLRIDIEGLRHPADGCTKVLRYDRVTGVLRTPSLGGCRVRPPR